MRLMHVHAGIHDADEAVKRRSLQLRHDGGVHGPRARSHAHRRVHAADERLEGCALEFGDDGGVEKSETVDAGRMKRRSVGTVLLLLLLLLAWCGNSIRPGGVEGGCGGSWRIASAVALMGDERDVGGGAAVVARQRRVGIGR